MKPDFEPTYPSDFMPDEIDMAPKPRPAAISGLVWKTALAVIVVIFAVVWLRR